MAVRVGEVSNLVDDEEIGPCIVAQAAAQGGIAVKSGEIAEQLSGAGEQHGMAVDECLIGDVARERRLADAVHAHDILPRNTCLKLSSIIRIKNALSPTGGSFTEVAFTL
jgi:hypothetical protein